MVSDVRTYSGGGEEICRVECFEAHASDVMLVRGGGNGGAGDAHTSNIIERKRRVQLNSRGAGRGNRTDAERGEGLELWKYTAVEGSDKSSVESSEAWRLVLARESKCGW